MPTRIVITSEHLIDNCLHASSILCGIHSADETQSGRNSCPEFAFLTFSLDSIMVVSNPRNDGTRNGGTTERERAERDFFSVFFFFFFFFFFFKQKNNNKQTVNISHKIKGMHIFFILRGRSRAKLSSLFRVRISRSVTALRTCLGHPFFFSFTVECVF